MYVFLCCVAMCTTHKQAIHSLTLSPFLYLYCLYYSIIITVNKLIQLNDSLNQLYTNTSVIIIVYSIYGTCISLQYNNNNIVTS